MKIRRFIKKHGINPQERIKPDSKNEVCERCGVVFGYQEVIRPAYETIRNGVRVTIPAEVKVYRFLGICTIDKRKICNYCGTICQDGKHVTCNEHLTPCDMENCERKVCKECIQKCKMCGESFCKNHIDKLHEPLEVECEGETRNCIGVGEHHRVLTKDAHIVKGWLFDDAYCKPCWKIKKKDYD